VKIAIAADASNLDSVIGEHFGMAKLLLLAKLDDDTLEMKTLKAVNMPECEENVGSLIVGEGCEAIISGKMSAAFFNWIADRQITRYNGSGLSVHNALEGLCHGALSFFTHAEEDGESGEGERWHGHESKGTESECSCGCGEE